MSNRQQIHLYRDGFDKAFRDQDYQNTFTVQEETASFENIDFIAYNTIQLDDLSYLPHKKIQFKNCKFLDTQQELNEVRIAGQNPEIILSDSTEFLNLRATDVSIYLSTCRANGIIISQAPKLKIDNCDIKNISISSSHIDGSTIWREVDIKKLDIRDSSFSKRFAIEKKSIINELILDRFTSEEGTISIKNSSIGEMLFSEVEASKLSVTDIDGGKVTIRKKCSFGDFHYKCSPVFDINGSTFKRGTVTSCTKEFSHFENNVTNWFTFEKNNYNLLEIQNQDVSNIEFAQNTGKIEFQAVHTDIFPDITSNEFSEVCIIKSEIKEFRQISSTCRIKNLTFSETKIEILEIHIEGIKSLIFDSGKLIGHASIILNKSETLEVRKSPFTELEIGGSIKQLKISQKHVQIVGQTLLEKIQSNNLTLNSLKSELVVVEHALILQMYLDNLDVNKLFIKSSGYESLILNGNEGKPNVLFGSSEQEKFNWRIELDKDSGVQLRNNDLNHLVICKSGALNDYILEDNIISTLTVGSRAINKLESKRNTIQSLVVSSKDQAWALFSEEDTIGHTRAENSHLSSLTFIKSNLARFEAINMRFEEVSFVSSLGFGANEIEQITFRDSRSSRMTIQDSNIKQLTLIRLSVSAKLTLKKLGLSTLILDEFKRDIKANNEMSFINIDRNAKAKVFKIHDSHLGEFEFNSCYFDSFEELDVTSSKLDEINCTATTWPKKVTSYDENGKSHPFGVREACRQLKLAMADHQDRVSELQFHALEMDAYRMIVAKNWYRPRNWNDSLSLFAGWTNSFGLNWIKPSLLLFSFNVILYWFTLKLHFNEPWLENPFRCGNVHDFLMLFNPVHKTKEIYYGTISGWIAFWDFIGRIITAFFLYQIVTAFRKYRK